MLTYMLKNINIFKKIDLRFLFKFDSYLARAHTLVNFYLNLIVILFSRA
jgi:hypothetical protein